MNFSQGMRYFRYLIGFFTLFPYSPCSQIHTYEEFQPTSPFGSSLFPSWTISSFLNDSQLLYNGIFHIDFGPNQLVWVASVKGLSCYDGYTWKLYTEVDGLPSRFVRCVLVTRDKKLWVGTDKGAGVFDGIHFNTYGSEQGLAGPSVRRIVEDPDGTLWFCCDRWPDKNVSSGLSSYKDGQWQIYRQAQGLPNDYITDYFRASDGSQYILTQKGLAQRRENHWIRLFEQSPPEERDAFFWSIVESPEYGLMITTDNDFVYVLKNGQWKRYAYYTPHSLVVGSTRNGLLLTCMEIEQSTRIIMQWNGEKFESITEPFSSLSGGIEVIKEAPDGAVWIVGFNCLARWDRSYKTWMKYENIPPPQILDDQNRLWFVGDNSAVRWKNGLWEKMSPFPDQVGSDSKKQVWGWSDSGIHCWSQNEVIDYSNAATGLAHPFGFTAAADGTVWFHGTDAQGKALVSHFTDHGWKPISVQEFSEASILSNFSDPERGAWYIVKPREKKQLTILHIIDENTREVLTPYPDITEKGDIVCLVDSKKNVWFGNTAGTYFYDSNKKQWSQVIGKSVDRVHTLLREKDYLWFCNSGNAVGRNLLVRCNVAANQWVSYSGDFLGNGTQLSDGTLIFAGYQSLYQIVPRNPDGIQKIYLPESGDFRSAVKDKEGNLWLGIGSSVFHYHPDLNPPDTLIVNPKTEFREGETSEIQFQGTEYYQPQDNRKTYRFSWRLNNGEWSAFQSLRDGILPLAGLRPGRHILQVRAQDEELVEDSTPAELVFYVAPISMQEQQWFKTTFFSLIVVIFLLAVYAFYAKNKLSFYTNHLEETVANRTAELRESEEHHRRLIETMNEGLIILNAEGAITYVNPRMVELLDLPLEVLSGRPISQFLQGNIAQLVPQQFLTQQPGQMENYEISWTRKDGQTFYGIASPQAIFDQQSRYQGSFIIITNITERKRLEEQLIQSKKIEAIGQLAGGVAHNINNLLTGIIGNLSLAEVRYPSDIRRYLKDARTASDRATELVRQLLAFSRKSKMELIPIKLSNIIKEVYTLARETIDRRIEMKLTLEDSLPLVCADSAQIHSVLMNLCVNARDAIMETMKKNVSNGLTGAPFLIHLEGFVREIDEAYCVSHSYAHTGRFLVIRVADNGAGMDEETKRHIFEPFFTTKEVGKGTGLGLASSLGIIVQHNGWIDITSEKEKGTTFEIYLPVTEQKAKPISQEIHAAVVGGQETLLLVDDEESIRRIGKEALESFGYQVLLAEDGRQALDLYRTESKKIDLVILDLSMPNFSGWEVLQELHTLNPQQKVIISSGYSDHARTENSDLANSVQWLDKPYSPYHLGMVVRKFLDTDNRALA